MDTTTDTAPASGQVNLPNGGQITSDQESPAEKTGAMQSWMNTAKPQAAAPPAAPNAAQPAAQASAQPPQTVPVPVTSLKRGGMLGVMDSIADVLVGKQKPEIGKDPQGNLYIKEHTMSHGEQWARIAGEAMRGAAAGFAAGKGAGNMAKAPLAGMEAEQKADTQEYDQMQKKVLDNANNQMLRMQMAAEAWKRGRLETEATQHDITFWQGQADRLEKEGATYLGDTAHVGDISHLRTANPDIMKDLVENHSLEFIPKASGGFAVYKTPEKYGSDILPVGQQFPTFNTVKDAYEWHKTVKPITQKEYDDYWTAAGISALKFRNDKKEGEVKAATAANLGSEKEARDQELQGKIDLTTAQTGEARASAQEKRAQAGKLNEETNQLKNPVVIPGNLVGGSTGNAAADAELNKWPSPVQADIRGMLDYSVNPEKAFPNRKSPKAGQMDTQTAIGIAKMIDPSYDGKQYDARHKLLQNFTSGKAAENIRSLNTAIQHIDRMAQSGEALNNTQWQLANAAKNTVGPWFGDTAPGVFDKDVNAVADELSTLFKGSGATDEQVKGWKETMKKAQTPEQIRTGVDEALALAGGRYDALDHQFSTGMGKPRNFQMLSPVSQGILSRLGAKEFLAKDGAAPTPQGGGEKIIPGEQTITMSDGSIGVARNGQWVKAQR